MKAMVCACLLLVAALRAAAPDLTGAWQFVEQLEGGGKGSSVFTFEQKGPSLTGTYKGALGEYPVIGTAKGEQVEFGFEFKRDGQSFRALYSGKVESEHRMAGVLGLGDAQRGKWTASRR